MTSVPPAAGPSSLPVVAVLLMVPSRLPLCRPNSALPGFFGTMLSFPYMQFRAPDRPEVVPSRPLGPLIIVRPPLPWTLGEKDQSGVDRRQAPYHRIMLPASPSCACLIGPARVGYSGDPQGQSAFLNNGAGMRSDGGLHLMSPQLPVA